MLVSDLAVCERRTGDVFAPLADDYLLASWGVGAVEGNEAATSSETLPEGGNIHVSWALWVYNLLYIGDLDFDRSISS